jgi:hypothetical protein
MMKLIVPFRNSSKTPKNTISYVASKETGIGTYTEENKRIFLSCDHYVGGEWAG